MFRVSLDSKLLGDLQEIKGFEDFKVFRVSLDFKVLKDGKVLKASKDYEASKVLQDPQDTKVLKEI